MKAWTVQAWGVAVAAMMLGTGAGACRAERAPGEVAETVVSLPAPRVEGPVSLEAAVAGRRSVRSFAPDSLTWEEIGQLLWSAQGVTDSRGLRAAPSAGATYPLELYILRADGVWHYRPAGHQVVRILEEDRRTAVWQAGLRQGSLRSAPVVVVMAAVHARTSGRYGARAVRYVDMEIGHAAQNLSLQAVALGLGSVMIGAMDEARVQAALDLPPGQQVLYLIPVGRPAR